MARLLLDSNVFFWWSRSPKMLSASIIQAVADADETFLSVATPWELELKQGTGKLQLPKGIWERLEQDGFSLLAIELPDTLAAARLPLHHRDPFDRRIIAQALRRGLTVVTRDPLFASYEVPVL